MADAMKLLPCPFCGTQPHVRLGANPYGSCRTEDCWVAERKITVPLDDTRQVAQWNRRASPPAREEAPGEGAGEFVKSVVLQDKLDRLSDEYGDLLTEVEALRNRTSEPEAGAVAGWERAWSRNGEVKTKDHTPKGWNLLAVTQHRLLPTDQPLYRRPAPATADKLRVAVEAFGVITDLSVNLRHGGPDSSDLHDLANALDTAVDVAAEALAALNEQPQ